MELCTEQATRFAALVNQNLADEFVSRRKRERLITPRHALPGAVQHEPGLRNVVAAA